MHKAKANPKVRRRRGDAAQVDDPVVRRQMIAEAAYYKAERRGFAPGGEDMDWLEAEKEIDDCGKGR